MQIKKVNTEAVDNVISQKQQLKEKHNSKLIKMANKNKPAHPKKKSFSQSISETYYNLTDYISANPQNASFIGVVAVIAIIGIAYWQYSTDAKNMEASSLLEENLVYSKKEDYEKAINGDSSKVIGLKELASKYDGTVSGDQAKLFLGNAYLKTGKWDEALEVFSDISRSSGTIVYAGSLSGQATCYANKGDYEKAAQLYLSASDIAEIYDVKALYLEQAAIHYELASKYKMSLSLFEKIKKAFPESNQAKEVDFNIALSKQKLQ